MRLYSGVEDSLDANEGSLVSQIKKRENMIFLLWSVTILSLTVTTSECGIKSDFWWEQETGDFQYGFISVGKIFQMGGLC